MRRSLPMLPHGGVPAAAARVAGPDPMSASAVIPSNRRREMRLIATSQPGQRLVTRNPGGRSPSPRFLTGSAFWNLAPDRMTAQRSRRSRPSSILHWCGQHLRTMVRHPVTRQSVGVRGRGHVALESRRVGRHRCRMRGHDSRFWAILLGVVIWTIAKYTRSPPPRGHEVGLPRKSPDHPFPPPHLRSPQRVLAPGSTRGFRDPALTEVAGRLPVSRPLPGHGRPERVRLRPPRVRLCPSS